MLPLQASARHVALLTATFALCHVLAVSSVVVECALGVIWTGLQAWETLDV